MFIQMTTADQNQMHSSVLSLFTLIRKLPHIHRQYRSRLRLFQYSVNHSRLQFAATVVALIGVITILVLQPQVPVQRNSYALLTIVSLFWLLSLRSSRLFLHVYRRRFETIIFHTAVIFYTAWAALHLHFTGGILGFATYVAIMISVPAIFSISPVHALFLGVMSLVIVYSPIHVVQHSPLEFTLPVNVLILNSILFAWFVAFLHYLTTIEVFLMRDTLTQKEHKAELALAGGNLGYWNWDIKNELIEVDDRWFAMLGYTRFERVFSFAEFFAFIHPADRKHLAENMQAYLHGGNSSYKHSFRMLTADNQWKWVYAEGQITQRSADKQPLFMHGIHQDIQTSRLQEQRLRESEARFKAYTENAPVGIFIVKDYRFSYVNPGAVRLTGYSEDELHDKRVTDLVHPDEYRRLMHFFYTILRKGVIEDEYVLRVLAKDRQIRWAEVRVSRLDLQASSYLLSVVDITARKNAEVRLQEYATYDELTGVYNRRVGLTLLQQELHQSKRESKPLSVCFVDVNGLKKVNDTWGHDEGDQLIQLVADVMREQLRRGDLLCRLGGDEFLMMYRNCSYENGFKIWERIEERFKDLNADSQKPYEISVSRGILEYDPLQHSDAHEFLNQADKIMYINKDQYRKLQQQRLKGTDPDPRLVAGGQ